MTQPASPALLQALALFRSPRSARPGPADRLPDGMLQLLRVVGGEEQALAHAKQATNETTETLREAVAFYIQQVMFATGSRSYRVLGVDPDASDDQLREHYRWLVRWLHPDRNANDWESVYADRVNRAWQDVRTPDRRQRFDQETQSERANVSSSSSLMPSKLPRAVAKPATDMSAWIRWLPTLIFGGLGVSAVLALSLFYALRWTDQEPAQAAQQALTEPVARPPIRTSETPVESPTPAPVPLVNTVGEDGESIASAVPDVSAPKAASVSAAAPTDRPSPVSVDVVTSAPALAAADPAKSEPTPHQVALPERSPTPSTKVLTNLVAGAPLPPPSVVAATAPPAPPAPIATAFAVSPSPAPDPIDDNSAHEVIGAFSDAYAQGDLARMRRLFTDDARDARGGLDGILSDYNRVFSDSQQRSLDVSDVSWLRNGNTATIIASYQATVVSRRDGRPRRVHGDLRLDLRLEGGQLRIYRLLHDENPG